MIKVTIELVSAIDPSRSRLLGVAVIANDGVRSCTDPNRGDYDVVLSKAGKRANTVWKRGRVENFPRRRLLGWDLLYLALRSVLGSRHESIEPAPAKPTPAPEHKLRHRERRAEPLFSKGNG